MFEINLTDHKSITARHFPDGDFSEVDRESVESEREKTRVEAEFSILKDYGQNKHHYSVQFVHHIWCLDDAGSRNLEGLFLN